MTDRNRRRQVWESIFLVVLVCGLSLPAGLESPAKAEPPPVAGDRPSPAPSPEDSPLASPLREPASNGEIWIDANGTLSNSRDSGSLRLPERSLLQPPPREPWNRSQPLGSAASASPPGVTEAVGLELPTHLAAAGPTSAVVLPPLASPPPPNLLDSMPVESAATLRASASMAIDPLTPPSVAAPQPTPLSPLSPNVGPFEVVDNSNELVVVLGRSKHLRTKVDVEGAEAADRSVCDVQLTTARDLTIAGRNPGVTRVVVRLEGDSPRPVVLLVRVVPDVTWQGASPRPAEAVARDPSVVQAPPPPPAPPPEQFGLRVIVAELDRTITKTAGIDTDSTSSPATMLLQSLPRAGGNAAVLKNRLAVCLGTRGLQEHGALRIFSEPILVVTSGRPARVLVHNQLPTPPTPNSGGSHPHANDTPARPTTLNLVATLLTKDRIRLELTAEQSWEPDAGLGPMGPSGPRAASAELGNGQTVAVCGLIDAPRKPPQESPEKFPIFSQFFTKPPPPPPHLTEMLVLITVEHLDPANAMSFGSPSAASSNAAQK